MRTCILVTFIAFTFFSCERRTATLENEKVVKQLYDYFNKHDWEKMANLYAEVAEFKDPAYGKDIVQQTRQQIVKHYSELGEMFPDVNDKVIEIYPSGEKHVIVEFVSTGTSQDGSRFEMPICTIFTIENGLITKDYTYYDNFEEPK
ncbi:nuclear transport factor 2 family protein [Chitinophaga silvatica]|uniref:Nuclear transport factor 2 family protein n=1 Tax=Chitinophaga silvatica TaxID=2282649 RepID=A0A3E1Y3M2_9BACT|nr:nuclear transport factor 2 family protein [Chitinophaga silvatica]RFS19253.1 nuclear transport factor 2 family protein [Chitinophaga silvatica]